VFEETIEKHLTIEGVCGDASYRKTMVKFVQNVLNRTIDISECITSKWVVLAKRWIIKRTFAWLNHFRRLSKDYEFAVKSAENIVIIAYIMILLNRLTNS
jgi:transposase